MNILVYNTAWEGKMIDYINTGGSIEEYCRKKGYKMSLKIDEKLHLVIRTRKWWCPRWLYKKIVRQSVELVKIY